MQGLYVHIPFCRSKCIYCDFYSVPRSDDMEKVARGLVTEYDTRRREIMGPFDTIYFGGGTPSAMPASLLSEICRHLPFNEVVEATIEVNPDDVTADSVKLWRSLGFNRVSMGVQTLDADILRRIGRRHTPQKALDAIRLLHDGGIVNISADLIYGLPGQSIGRWQNDLDTLMTSPITHLSAYSLTYHEGTMLYRQMLAGKITPADDDTTTRYFEILRASAAAHGFEHYEISNLARPGFRSRHNSAYWNPSSRWLGIGPSAHSFDGNIRRIDLPSIPLWLKSLPRPFEIDDETRLDRINDNIVTALRTADGLDLASIPEPWRSSVLAEARRFITAGHMHLRDNRLIIDQSHWIISDSYIRDLIQI